MWFGFIGGGVSRYDGETFTRYDLDNDLPDDQWRAMMEDRRGDLCFGFFNRGGLLRYWLAPELYWTLDKPTI